MLHVQHLHVKHMGCSWCLSSPTCAVQHAVVRKGHGSMAALAWHWHWHGSALPFCVRGHDVMCVASSVGFRSLMCFGCHSWMPMGCWRLPSPAVLHVLHATQCFLLCSQHCHSTVTHCHSTVTTLSLSMFTADTLTQTAVVCVRVGEVHSMMCVVPNSNV